MGKYSHEANLNNVVVVKKLLHFMKLIQASLRYQYYYYVCGEIKISKVHTVIDKFDEYYNICETSLDRKRRYELNQPTVKFIMFYPDGANKVYYILLARKGCNGSRKHLFFEREKYLDLTKPTQKLTINHYELNRINKEKYVFDNASGKQTHVPAANEVWTYDLTNQYIAQILDNIRMALIRRDSNLVNQLLRSFENVIPFHGVRKSYNKVAAKINLMVEKSSNANGKWINVHPLPRKLKILRGSVINKYNLVELLESSIIKSKGI